MRIALLLPNYGYRPAEADQTAAIAIAKLSMTHEIHSIMQNDTYIHNSRTKLARRMLELHAKNPFDWVMHIDSDMVFTAQDVDTLLKIVGKNNLVAVSGLYFSKNYDAVLPLVFKEDNGSWVYFENIPKNKDFFEASGVGLGFFLCKPYVYYSLQKKFGNNFFDCSWDSQGRIIGEDQVFCKRLRELGYKIFVVPKVKVLHAGGLVGYREHLAWLQEKKKKRKKNGVSKKK